MIFGPGKISIEDLRFDCILGTLPFEREVEQAVVLNVSIWLDFMEAARNEDLAHSVDYAQLSDDLIYFIRESKFNLEETLVVETAKYILSNYPKALSAEVTISKPGAIPNAKAATSTIRLTRE
ncbi:MAG: dihydroneopterin aldolase [Fibrobacteraceae bacterium]|nr:dihydroneopterin aldolase [Fibrobacteraceae bacterium]